jgi:hypothetical protein
MCLPRNTLWLYGAAFGALPPAIIIRVSGVRVPPPALKSLQIDRLLVRQRTATAARPARLEPPARPPRDPPGDHLQGRPLTLPRRTPQRRQRRPWTARRVPRHEPCSTTSTSLSSRPSPARRGWFRSRRSRPSSLGAAWAGVRGAVAGGVGGGRQQPQPSWSQRAPQAALLDVPLAGVNAVLERKSSRESRTGVGSVHRGVLLTSPIAPPGLQTVWIGGPAWTHRNLTSACEPPRKRRRA